GEGTEWAHPSKSRRKTLLWMREPDFFAGYSGKRLVFGHTPTTQLPTDHLGPVATWFDDPGGVWLRGDLGASDTGAAKGGPRSAVRYEAQQDPAAIEQRLDGADERAQRRDPQHRTRPGSCFGMQSIGGADHSAEQRGRQAQPRRAPREREPEQPRGRFAIE